MINFTQKPAGVNNLEVLAHIEEKHFGYHNLIFTQHNHRIYYAHLLPNSSDA